VPVTSLYRKVEKFSIFLNSNYPFITEYRLK